MTDRNDNPRNRWMVPLGLVLIVAGLGWYIGSRTADNNDTDEPATAQGGVYRDVAGQIVRLNPEDDSITVDHEEIPGFMRAMVMDLKVAERRELRGLEPGDAIRFDLVHLEGTYQIVNIRPRDIDDDEGGGGDGRGGGGGGGGGGEQSALGPGDNVPDLELVNAHGQRFRLHELQPRHKLITFFYARCPIEHVCPAQSARLAQLQQHLRDAGSDLHLVSLTLDSEHDSADVLAGYAQRFDADAQRWTLASGDDPDAVRAFARAAGARVQRHDDSFEIDHALVALRVDGTRIVDRVYGLDAMQRLVRGMR